MDIYEYIEETLAMMREADERNDKEEWMRLIDALSKNLLFVTKLTFQMRSKEYGQRNC